jgi:hypothetical protein
MSHPAQAITRSQQLEGPVERRRSTMRWIGTAALAIVLVAAAPEARAQRNTADLRIGVSGTDPSGAVMRTACDLDFVSVPSNVFEGPCRVIVGSDELVLVGRDADRQRVPTLLLNGVVTIRGFLESGTGSFASLADGGRAGFPVYLEIDPLGRAWSIRADTPAGGTETVSSGVVTGGRIFLVLP